MNIDNNFNNFNNLKSSYKDDSPFESEYEVDINDDEKWDTDIEGEGKRYFINIKKRRTLDK